MREQTVEVKSKGKVVDNIVIKQFESLEEAIKELTKDGCLSLINRQYKADTTNEARAAKTRTSSPLAQLNKKLKEDPEKVKAILAELGIEI